MKHRTPDQMLAQCRFFARTSINTSILFIAVKLLICLMFYYKVSIQFQIWKRHTCSACHKAYRIIVNVLESIRKGLNCYRSTSFWDQSVYILIVFVMSVFFSRKKDNFSNWKWRMKVGILGQNKFKSSGK